MMRRFFARGVIAVIILMCRAMSRTMAFMAVAFFVLGVGVWFFVVIWHRWIWIS